MMQMDIKEILCESCAHCEVCSYKEKYRKVVNTIDDCLIGLPDGTGAYDHVNLCDISWIKPVEVKCKHYMKKEIVFR